MADLTDYRKEIDDIDSQLIQLFERRMNVVRKVGQYKLEHNLEVLQTGREQAVLQKAAENVSNSDYAEDAKQFMRAAMEISRAAQRRDHQNVSKPQIQSVKPSGRIGFQGVPGSFSEQALIDFFGTEQERIACKEFRDVFDALQNGTIDYGVLPIENSSSGAISAVYDLLACYGFAIVGERLLKVRHNLAVVEHATLDTIEQVYSHEQGLLQSSEYLSTHPNWTLIPQQNTAVSAKYVAQSNDPTKAAVCSTRAANLYGLKILAPEIQNNHKNTTRFIIVARKMQTSKANKVSIMFTLDNEAGTLYEALRFFAEKGINLVKIESRPIPETLWNYRFYLDFEGTIDSDQVKATLEAIAQNATDFRILGAYCSDHSKK